MPQEVLNRSDVVTGLQQMSCKAVSKRMRGDAFEQSRLLNGCFYGPLHMPFMDVISQKRAGR